ncbi:hypothetical protein DNTS_002624 [Danionella cerebrum]|uniref:THD domain-containing protein n=1 Tax=Danionella cerebrum TaxID=2873325 RepID=A0A553MVC7_9TELE|nr:hypothetical protein DNTS_002624 [Danionella translucida]
MINTYHSSFGPPPVPPRAGYTKAPGAKGNTPLVKFLSVMLLLLMLLTFGGFFYFFQKLNLELHGSFFGDMVNFKSIQDCLNGKNGKECQNLMEHYKDIMDKVSSANGKAFSLTGAQSFNGPAARLELINENNPECKKMPPMNKNLWWDRQHSLLMGVELDSTPDMLKIKIPGIYFIHSQVSFSRYHPSSSLKQSVMSTKRKTSLLQSFCTVNQNATEICTATTAGIFPLEKHEKIFVSVTNTSLINRNSCLFGLFKLR